MDAQIQTGVDPSGPPALCVDSVKPCASFGLTFLSALLLVLSCLQLSYHRSRHRTEAGAVLYRALGHLCGTVGALLCKQLYIQILMEAFAAATDALTFLTHCLLVCLCWNSPSERRLRMMKRRRRQQHLAVCVMFVLAGGLLRSEVSRGPADRPVWGRRLHFTALQDNTETLGYVLGLLSLVITSTSRLPAIYKAHRGLMQTKAHAYAAALCSLAWACYAAAILLHGSEPEFLFRVAPWLLSAVCGVILDLLNQTFVIHLCKRGSRVQLGPISPDAESLLEDAGVCAEERAAAKRLKLKVKSPEHKQAKNLQLTDMGRYMDVSVKPSRQICLKDATVSQDQMNDQHPLNRAVRVIRVGSLWSSDTSCDSSLVSSDLEWDFEEVNTKWNEQKTKQHEEELCPQVWPGLPKS